MEHTQKPPLREYRIRLNPTDVRRLRERALAESREGHLVHWGDYVRAAIADPSRAKK